MMVNKRVPLTVALVLLTSTLPFAFAQGVPECADGVDNDGDGGTDWLGTANDPNAPFEDWDQDCTWPGDPSESSSPSICTHSSPHSHSYGTGGSVGAKSDQVTGGEEVGAGLVTVSDTNTQDCNGDGLPRDFDGDYDAGVGGAFFGFGPWADESVCSFGLRLHGGSVVVNDVVFGSGIAFVTGADDQDGPDLTPDPVTGEPACTTSGSITPGDPATDPTADADDCLSQVYTGSGAACGAGGDGGYWVFLSGVLASESGGNPGVNNAPTIGTITA